jgi:hypothetical protein
MNTKKIAKFAAMSKKKIRGPVPPVSGSESTFKYEPWGTKGIHANNCYDYAIGDYKSYRPVKSTPGDRAGMPEIKSTLRTCAGMRKRMLADNPGNIYECKANTPCRRGFYKIMMFVAPTNDYGQSTGDFHFYKQHHLVKYRCKSGDTVSSLAKFFEVTENAIRKGGTVQPGRIITVKASLFSHKMGWGTGPLLVDSNNRIIKNPITAGRDYGYNYTDYCSSFCVRKGKAKSGAKKR